MRIKTGKRDLWCLARDYGANPPMMKHCTMIEDRNGYMLTWDGGRAYMFARWERQCCALTAKRSLCSRFGSCGSGGPAAL